MAQSPSWEANRFSASQEIPRILWNSKVRYRIHKRLPLFLILSKLKLYLDYKMEHKNEIFILISR
jgi:hypothetical protein